ncbi:MAG: hypothetical protein ABIJ21_08155 [Nanoarchaeota archaeon]
MKKNIFILIFVVIFLIVSVLYFGYFGNYCGDTNCPRNLTIFKFFIIAVLAFAITYLISLRKSKK